VDIIGTLLGGVAGAAGAVVQKVLDNRDKKSEREHLQEMAKLGQLGEAAKAQASLQVSAIDLQRASMEADKATYGGGWADTVRALVRPAVTAASLALLVAVAWGSYSEGGFSAEQRLGMVDAAVTLAQVAVGWWFGARIVRKT
jgi:hypothetical protein